MGLCSDGAERRIAAASENLFDHRGHMISGTLKIHMWPWPSEVRLKHDTDIKIPWLINGPPTDNAAAPDAPHLCVCSMLLLLVVVVAVAGGGGGGCCGCSC